MLTHGWSSFLEFIKDEEGQGTVEYILILSASMVAARQISRALMGALDKGMVTLGAQLERDLKTGRVPLSVWQD